MGATALLLNWKRPDNMIRVIESIRSQTIDTEILLWNNNPNDLTEYGVDLQINSSKNLMCYPRWFLMNYASNEYVFSLDDDLMFRDNKVLGDCIEYLKEKNCIIGQTGVILNDEKKYWGSKHILKPNKNQDIEVDIIKGRFIFGHKKLFSTIRLVENIDSDIKNPKIEDDIFISSNISNKIIPSFLCDRFKGLNEMGVGCWTQAGHKQMRQIYTHKYFK